MISAVPGNLRKRQRAHALEAGEAGDSQGQRVGRMLPLFAYTSLLWCGIALGALVQGCPLDRVSGQRARRLLPKKELMCTRWTVGPLRHASSHLGWVETFFASWFPFASGRNPQFRLFRGRPLAKSVNELFALYRYRPTYGWRELHSWCVATAIRSTRQGEDVCRKPNCCERKISGRETCRIADPD